MFLKKVFLLLILFVLISFDFTYALCSSSHSCILIDNESARILYSKNINSKQLIASTTKLMTFLIAYENGNLDDYYIVSEEVLKMYGTSIYLSIGEKVSLRDLLYGLILRSGNDASVVIANNVGKSYDHFIELMNKKAKEIGMRNTIFKNPHGLDEESENYSTSYDMALLSRYLHKIPFYLEVSSTKHYMMKSDLKTYDWYNRNKLLSLYKNTISGKNGYTPRAGKTLVSGAMKNNLSLSAVSLDDGDIYNTHIKLYDYGFNTFSRYMVVNKDEFFYEDKYYGGRLYVEESFYYPVKENEVDKLNILVQIIKDVDLNVSNKVGNLIVYLDNEEIYREDLFIEKEEVKKDKGFFDKVLDFFRKIF